ncbi:MAG: DUF2294 domain-containing protein [Planctomycetes bacterium]|nr:DUF2294 domain-containing protein [Planctomycetota bacterium]
MWPRSSAANPNSPTLGLGCASTGWGCDAGAARQSPPTHRSPRGRDLIKQIRLELIEHGRELLEVAVRDILGVPVVSVHTDISTRTGESIILFTLESKPPYKPA